MRRVLESQKFGGWNCPIAFQSMLRLLSSKVVAPWGKNCFSNTIAQNSPDTAIMVLEAHEVLGEESCLDAAQKTAETPMKIQRPDRGWANSVYFSSGGERTVRCARTTREPRPCVSCSISL